MLNIKVMPVGQLGTNCYIVSDPETKEGMIIDPGGDDKRIIAYIKDHGIKVRKIINTHGHFDHSAADDFIRDAFDAPLWIHQRDEVFLTDPKSTNNFYMGQPIVRKADHYLVDQEMLPFGKYQFLIIHTPGHTQGGCCLYEATEKICFTGDTLFEGTVGRTDLYGGDYAMLIKSLQEKLAVLPDDVTIYPGHGDHSTMGAERKYNPYLR